MVSTLKLELELERSGAGLMRSRAGAEPGWCGADAGVGAELVFDVGGSTRT